MKNYCLSVLSQGNHRFLCPHVNADTSVQCGREWQYFMVRHVACLSPKDMETFESRLCENYARKARGIQKCPGCKVFCMRQDCTNNSVYCLLCEKEFCWLCLHDWSEGFSKCNNPECDGVDSRIRCLRRCPKKRIYGMRCPSVRGCPNCGILINHKDGCKHMICKGCGHAFCFVCLKARKRNGKYPCRSWRYKCPVAPVQTTLPGTD